MRRKAVILALSEDLSEMRALISSLGYIVTSVQVQNRAHPDPQTFLGRGRIEQLSRDIAEGAVEADVAVVAGDLDPDQVLRLENELDVTVLDRVRLILEIFADRADNEEAKLQVELARLEYELPLVREELRQLKHGERAGYQAGGATAYETQVRHLEGRMKQIESELDSLKQDRQVRRKHRRHGGFWQISLAGYTNAGKSTLLNALTEAHVTTENRLFSTLETRTRRVVADGASNSRILMTDTVGFIEDLPPWLVEAFHATLEEVAFSDLVLLVVDGSDPMEDVERKLSSSLDILRGFLADRGRLDLAENIFLVINKTDQAPDRDWATVAQAHGLGDRFRTVSARTGDGVDELLTAIRGAIPDRQVVDIDLPYSGDAYALIDKLDHMGELEGVEETSTVTARVALSSAQVSKVEDEVDELDGEIVPVA
ncbi:GTPase HflX [Thermoplasmatales archaeon SW_10_69_26]|nr:MAG: GTPase HflX [Thermoplasmatales archaeon SW_10_69_26]